MKPLKETRGKSIITFPSDYTVIDLETTGLNPLADSIIEVAGLKVRNGEIVDTFCSLVYPQTPVSEFIQEFTGITDQMLQDAPSAQDIIPAFVDFIETDIVVGHNVVFDVSFIQRWIYECSQREFRNDFTDTLRIARKIYPHLSHHRLSDMIAYRNLPPATFHRALGDCQMTHALFCAMQTDMLDKFGSFENFIDIAVKRKKHKKP